MNDSENTVSSSAAVGESSSDSVSSFVLPTIGDIGSSSSSTSSITSVSSDSGIEFLQKSFSSYSVTEMLLLCIAVGLFISCLIRVFKGK